MKKLLPPLATEIGNLKGERAAVRLAELAIDHVLLRRGGGDAEEAIQRCFKSSVGLPYDRGMTFSRAFKERFRIDPDLVEVNRQWRLVFVAPRFAFQERNDRSIAETTKVEMMKRYLSMLSARGMRFHFIEYRLFAKWDGKCHGAAPWTIAWRVNEEWRSASVGERMNRIVG
jgi:hypothetical protein